VEARPFFPVMRRRTGSMLSGLVGSGVDSAALMLGVDRGRLRAEFAAMRVGSRVVLCGLLIFITCAVAATIAILVGMASSASLPGDVGEPNGRDVATSAPRNYDVIVARPVFSRSRQPAAAPTETMSAAVVDRQINLRGVFINGAVAKAYMLSPQTPLGVWRKRGEEFEGWRVEDVAPDRVTLTSQAERMIVPLTVAGAGGR
jgi:hypothetical protein